MRHHRYSSQMDAAARRKGTRIGKIRNAAYRREERAKHPKTVKRRIARKR